MLLELVVPFKIRLLAYFALRQMDGISLNESIRIRRGERRKELKNNRYFDDT